MPERIQLSRAKGWRMPAGAVKVDRSTRWGNPFAWQACQAEWGGSDAEARAAAVDMYRSHIVDGAPAHAEAGGLIDLHEIRCHFFAHIHELRGKDLACWCPAGDPCHADLLIEIANRGSGA